MSIHNATSKTFDQLTTSSKLVIVDFWADWCSPCKQLAPILDELAADFNDHIDVVKVDTNAEPGIGTQYGIMALPTLLFFKDGQVVKTIQGGQSKRALTKAIEGLI